MHVVHFCGIVCPVYVRYAEGFVCKVRQHRNNSNNNYYCHKSVSCDQCWPPGQQCKLLIAAACIPTFNKGLWNNRFHHCLKIQFSKSVYCNFLHTSKLCRSVSLMLYWALNSTWKKSHKFEQYIDVCFFAEVCQICWNCWDQPLLQTLCCAGVLWLLSSLTPCCLCCWKPPSQWKSWQPHLSITSKENPFSSKSQWRYMYACGRYMVSMCVEE